jgi:hypothetical protein
VNSTKRNSKEKMGFRTRNEMKVGKKMCPIGDKYFVFSGFQRDAYHVYQPRRGSDKKEVRNWEPPSL